MHIIPIDPIKTNRKDLKLTQEQLANKINNLIASNLTKVEISKWESGIHKPCNDYIFAMAKIFDKNPIQFYGKVQEYHNAWKSIRRQVYEENNKQ